MQTSDIHRWDQMIRDAHPTYPMYPGMGKVTFCPDHGQNSSQNSPEITRDLQTPSWEKRPPELLKDEEYELTAMAPRNFTKSHEILSQISREYHVNSWHLATLNRNFIRIPSGWNCQFIVGCLARQRLRAEKQHLSQKWQCPAELLKEHPGWLVLTGDYATCFKSRLLQYC